jgi:hypothetical protein
MADYDLKSITADTDGPSADTELLFGSPDQAAGTPKPYSFAGIKTWIKSWSDALYLDAASNLSDLADADAARLNLVVGYGMPRNRFYTFTDCFYGSGLTDHWSGQWSGTGAGLGAIAVGALNAIGILSLDLGTTTSGRAALVASNGNPMGMLKLGSGRARFQAKAAIHTLSSGTETYTTRLGFLDTYSGESTDGCFFRYTDGVNSGEWQAVTRSNGTETATDTNVAVVADAWKLFEIDVNAAGTSVVFKIDGATVATNATNIPTGSGREMGYGAMSLKSAGTTATSGGYVDFMEVEALFTAQR